MKHLYRLVVQRQLLRHKLFYILLFCALFSIILTTQDTWLINGWIKYCNSAKINLSYFTSIFELLAAFNLAYTVILKFKGDVSVRLYSWTITSLETSRLYVDEILVTNEIRNENNAHLAEYIQDLRQIRADEQQHQESDDSNPDIDPFLYFGLFAICCLLMSGLTSGLEASTPFKIKAYSFLLLFTLISILYVELSYYFSKRSHFEVTIFMFFILILISFSLIRIVDFTCIKNLVDYHPLIRFLFPQTLIAERAINYIVLLCVLVTLYPYFLTFRSLYFKCMQYTCTSFQVISVVRTQVTFEAIIGNIGLLIINFGEKITKFGADIKNKRPRRKDNP